VKLDTEDWGDFYLGCAGGVDVDVRRAATPEAVPAAHRFVRIALGGLRGGHSGVDIHEERGNAIKLLVRVLQRLAVRTPFRLATLAGGTARNALPREAVATLALPASEDPLDGWLATMADELRDELAGVDDGLTLRADPCAEAPVMRRRADAVAFGAACGAARRAPDEPAAARCRRDLEQSRHRRSAGGRRECPFHGPFAGRPRRRRAGRRDRQPVRAGRHSAVQSGFLPRLGAQSGSPLLGGLPVGLSPRVRGESRVRVVHAGLECGIIGEKYPGLDIVSFGPTIRGAHAPGERVEVAAVARCWHLLTAILAELSGEGR
jgi:dipeptidase D